MTQDLLLALQITVIGMSLVFGSIILFWLVMVILVRVTSTGHPREGATSSPGVDRSTEGERRASGLQGDESPKSDLRKRRAAAAAIAVALARRSSVAGLPARLTSPPAQTSAWQVVQRAKSLRIFPRGPAR